VVSSGGEKKLANEWSFSHGLCLRVLALFTTIHESLSTALSWASAATTVQFCNGPTSAGRLAPNFGQECSTHLGETP